MGCKGGEGREQAPLASTEERPGVLLNTLQFTAFPTTRTHPVQNVNSDEDDTIDTKINKLIVVVVVDPGNVHFCAFLN